MVLLLRSCLSPPLFNVNPFTAMSYCTTFLPQFTMSCCSCCLPAAAAAIENDHLRPHSSEQSLRLTRLYTGGAPQSPHSRLVFNPFFSNAPRHRRHRHRRRRFCVRLAMKQERKEGRKEGRQEGRVYSALGSGSHFDIVPCKLSKSKN